MSVTDEQVEAAAKAIMRHIDVGGMAKLDQSKIVARDAIAAARQSYFDWIGEIERQYSSMPAGERAAFSNGVALGLERAARGAAWRRIETAPKDGTKFLAVTQGKIRRLDWMDKSLSTKQFANERSDDRYTHWMPLPAAPTAEDKK